MRNTAVLVLSLSLAGGTLVAENATVKSLLAKDQGSDIRAAFVPQDQPGAQNFRTRKHGDLERPEIDVALESFV